MKFMLMMHHPGREPYALASWSPGDMEAHIAFMKGFAERLAASGELVAAEGLAHPAHAKRVVADPEREPQVDGIFPETKEFLVGFWILDVDSPERAYALAAEASAAPGPGGAPLKLAIEVRQVMGVAPRDD